MAAETDQAKGEREKGKRKAEIPDVEELERRVHLAELRAREAEAEVRLFEANAKRRAMRSGRKESRGK